ncbi:MAG: hypothetical protein AAFR17_15385 [Pseudomonadota bacterium]
MSGLIDFMMLAATLITALCCGAFAWQMSRAMAIFEDAKGFDDTLRAMSKAVERLHRDVGQISDQLHTVTVEAALQDDHEALHQRFLELKVQVKTGHEEIAGDLSRLAEKVAETSEAAQADAVGEEIAQLSAVVELLEDRMRDLSDQTRPLIEADPVAHLATLEERVTEVSARPVVDLAALQADFDEVVTRVDALEPADGDSEAPGAEAVEAAAASADSRLDDLTATTETQRKALEDLAASTTLTLEKIGRLADRLDALEAGRDTQPRRTAPAGHGPEQFQDSAIDSEAQSESRPNDDQTQAAMPERAKAVPMLDETPASRGGQISGLAGIPAEILDSDDVVVIVQNAADPLSAVQHGD